MINLKKQSNPMGQGRTNEMLLILKHLPSISYQRKKRRKRFGDDLEKIWRCKTEQPRIGKEI